VEAAINRYRVMAVVVGVMLLLVVFVGMPIRYIGGNGTPSAIISPTHGMLYIVYLAVAFDLYRKAAWPLKQMVLMVTAGLIPFLAFYIERRIVRDARADLAARRAAQAPSAKVQDEAPNNA
jgi:integral membrane protein